MSVTTVQVHLPAYSHSFNVSVPSESTVQDFKHAISRACIGEPQVSGQRVIFRGRVLEDSENVSEVWKSDEAPHVCHLAVHPSAWKSTPPNTPSTSQTVNPLPQIQPNAPYYPFTQAGLAPPPLTRPPLPLIQPIAQQGRSTYLFIQYMHTNALRILARQQRIPWPEQYGTLADSRYVAKRGIEAAGRGWPSFLNDDFPVGIDEDATEGVVYTSTYIDGLPYLSLTTPNATPTPLQQHAIRVLSYTFPLLCVNPSAPLPSNLLHVNPPRPFAPFGVRGPGLQIPIRPLILPIIMLFIRTCLLFYFFQPTRKPVMGAMMLIWVIWELVGAVRGAFGQAERRNNARGAFPRGQDAGAGAGNAGGNPNAPADANQPAQRRQGGGIGEAANPNRPPSTQDLILNHLSQINIQEESHFVEPSSTPPVTSPPPTLLHKAKTFFILLVLTLHPAIWDRRRTTLRAREGRIRDEARTREARIGQRERERQEREEMRRRGAEVPDEEPEAEVAPVVPKPFWVVEYSQRVRSGDWVDDS